MLTKSRAEKLEVSAVTHPGFGGFMELDQQPQRV